MKNEWKHFKLDSKEYEYTYSMSGDLKISYRKRDLEPIIVKSGETWVARFEGIDYLWIGDCRTPPDFCLGFSEKYHTESLWNHFSEIEITDEIAKLRPRLKTPEFNERFKRIAIHRLKKQLFYRYTITEGGVDFHRTDWCHISNASLATVKDLEE